MRLGDSKRTDQSLDRRLGRDLNPLFEYLGQADGPFLGNAADN
jgi:hypothetical protein